MASRSDTLVWVALALQAGLIYVFVRDRLGTLQTVTETKQEEPPEPEEKTRPTQEDEDALKLDTLRALSEHPDFEIRNKACTIVAERTVKGDTKYLILRDLASDDPIVRDQALTGLNYLIDKRTSLDKPYYASYFRDLPTYRSVIRCLENLLFEHTDTNHMFTSSIVPKTRPVSERKALRVLAKLVSHDTNLALKAGIVSRWLVKYPFPFLEDEGSKRADVVKMVTEHAGDWEGNWGRESNGEDPDMGEIIRSLTDCDYGSDELAKHGLCPPRRRNGRDLSTQTIPTDMWMVGGEPSAGFMPAFPGERVPDGDPVLPAARSAPSGVTTRRYQGESLEERTLRRRRREAMVLNEGGRPLGRESIFQRRPTTGQLEPRDRARRESDRVIEREMARLRDEVDREDEEMGLEQAAEREEMGLEEAAERELMDHPRSASGNTAQNRWGWIWDRLGW